MKKINLELIINDFIVFKFTKVGCVYFIALLGYDVFHKAGSIKQFFNGRAYPL